MVVSGRLTPLAVEDARILALERGPIRGHTLTVLVVEDPPENPVEALRAELQARLPETTRWKQRLVPAPESATGLAWEDDPAFELARHVRSAGSGQAVDEKELRRLASRSMAAPLDRDHPLWTLEIVPRLADGRWALLWKVHHCLADGVMKMRAGSRLLWTEEPSPPRAPGKVRATAGVHPMRFAKLLGYRGLVLREFRRVWRLSPLAGEVGGEREVAFARCTLDELRSAGKAIAPEVTINDVLLAVVAGALRKWLRERRERPGRMKVQVPVSLHLQRVDEDPCGNRDSFLFLGLPLSEADPVERVRAVSRATRLRKNRHDARAIDAVRRVLGQAPAPLQRRLQRVVQGPHEYSLNVSNVPGPAGPIRVLGRRVDALYTLAEIAPHHALRIAADSMGGSLFLGLCADPRVVQDLEGLAAGIRGSLDELRERLRLTTG